MPPKSKYGVRGNYKGRASEHPLYFRWTNMLRRCYEPSSHGYASYGGKGVTVEPYLKVFSNYVDFVSKLPNYNMLLENPEAWQIDKDLNGGKIYSRETIRIVPSSENLEIENSEKRFPVYRILKDGTKEFYPSICEAEKATGIHRGNIARSARSKWKAGGYKWGYAF